MMSPATPRSTAPNTCFTAFERMRCAISLELSGLPSSTAPTQAAQTPRAGWAAVAKWAKKLDRPEQVTMGADVAAATRASSPVM